MFVQSCTDDLQVIFFDKLNIRNYKSILFQYIDCFNQKLVYIQFLFFQVH